MMLVLQHHLVTIEQEELEALQLHHPEFQELGLLLQELIQQELLQEILDQVELLLIQQKQEQETHPLMEHLHTAS